MLYITLITMTSVFDRSANKRNQLYLQVQKMPRFGQTSMLSTGPSWSAFMGSKVTADVASSDTETETISRSET